MNETNPLAPSALDRALLLTVYCAGCLAAILIAGSLMDAVTSEAASAVIALFDLG